MIPFRQQTAKQKADYGGVAKEQFRARKTLLAIRAVDCTQSWPPIARSFARRRGDHLGWLGVSGKLEPDEAHCLRF